MAPAAEAIGLNVPPTGPLPGQCWIVGSAPTAAWSEHPGALACWTEGGWRFVPSAEGLMVWSKDQQLWSVREASGWVTGTVRAGRVQVDGQEVLGPRQPSVAPPTGGSTVDPEARTAINELISRLIVHGLIDP